MEFPPSFYNLSLFSFHNVHLHLGFVVKFLTGCGSVAL
jgi:hypothetical protein